MTQSIEPLVCPGLFYATPARDGTITRIRIPGGLLTSQQSRVLAEVADHLGAETLLVTNRANIQIRAHYQPPTADILAQLQQHGLAAPVARVDHLRNIMASPTAGIDRQSHLDPRPLVQTLDRYLATTPTLEGLSAKFSIGLDGGETVSVRDRPNDVWLVALTPGSAQPRLALYCSVAKGQELDTGLQLASEAVVPVVAAIVQFYLQQAPAMQAAGQCPPGKSPRLRQVIQHYGPVEFVAALRQALAVTEDVQSVRSPVVAPSPTIASVPPVGEHPQAQAGYSYLGVVAALGQFQPQQLRGLAACADRYGSGRLRLTPWQSLVLPDLPSSQVPVVQQRVQDLGLQVRANHPWSAMVACAGNTGCAASATDTQADALRIAHWLEAQPLAAPLRIHLTGCPKSCAQFYAGDLALVGVAAAPLKASSQASAPQAAYDLYVGTVHRSDQPEASHPTFGRRLLPAVPIDRMPDLLQGLLRFYEQHRDSRHESFATVVDRYSIADLTSILQHDHPGWLGAPS